VNTTFQWQQWNGSCTESSSDCRNLEDQCWLPLHTNNSFQLNTSGKYRLKVQSGSCTNFFYFEVFTAGLGGNVGDVIHQTDFSQGSVKVSMNTSGISYNIRVFEDGDKVFLHTVYNFAGTGEQVAFDIFRFYKDFF